MRLRSPANGERPGFNPFSQVRGGATGLGRSLVVTPRGPRKRLADGTDDHDTAVSLAPRGPRRPPPPPPQPRLRAALPGEGDLADDRAPLRRWDPRGGRRERRRDREIAPRVVDAHAPRRRAVQLRARERGPGRAIEHRGDELEASPVDPRRLSARPVLRRNDHRLGLDSERPPACTRQGDRGARLTATGAKEYR